MTSVDLHIRPIRHRLADWTCAHAFILLFAANIVWHLRLAWAPLTFCDEAPPGRIDPVLLATRSASAATNAAARCEANGQELRPFQGLLDHLATHTRHSPSVPGTAVSFERPAELTPTQRKAFEHINVAIPVRLV